MAAGADGFPVPGGGGPREAVLHYELRLEDSLLSRPFPLEVAIR